MEAVMRAHEVKKSNSLLLRRTFPELESSLLLYFRREVPRELYSDYNDSKHIVTWRNGSTTRFGYSQTDNDIYQYQGAEFLFIGIDELTFFTHAQWQFLTSRNRCPVPDSKPGMAATTNPGNIGHAWVKALWVDKQPPAGMDRPEQYDPRDYALISARVYDNPIYAGDTEYLKALKGLPDAMRRAFLDGDWNVFAGQYFDNFNVDRHVVRPEQIQFEKWWPRWISVDWGFEHPVAIHWHTTAPIPIAKVQGAGGADQPIEVCDAAMAARPSGSQPSFLTITYREFFSKHLSPREIAYRILELSHDEKISAIYLSPDAFARHTDVATIANQMGDIFNAFGMPRPVPADNDRVGGWMLMYQMLAAGEWQITSNCTELIHTLPNLVRDNAHIEDIAKVDGDDPADSARYGLKSRHSFGPSQAPYEQRVAQRMTSTDPTIRAIQARKAQQEIHAHGRPIHFARKRNPFR